MDRAFFLMFSSFGVFWFFILMIAIALFLYAKTHHGGPHDD
jgi:hypothetical protein